jgi:hypothetical protein
MKKIKGTLGLNDSPIIIMPIGLKKVKKEE